jgi:ActR/RegA family two-component response regulator
LREEKMPALKIHVDRNSRIPIMRALLTREKKETKMKHHEQLMLDATRPASRYAFCALRLRNDAGLRARIENIMT